MTAVAQTMAGRVAQALACSAQVPSPCISVCAMLPATGLCAGCYRSIEEIAAWSRMDDDGKRLVWQRIAQRAGLAMPGQALSERA
jgi:hypothetical protein